MISLNYKDSRPIYEQIKESFRRLVISGALKPGDKLPSVREMAASLAINPNTIQRAYRELESEGVIYSVSGKGSFVSEETAAGEERRREKLAHFDEAVRELHFLGLEAAELKTRVDAILDGGREEK